MSSSAHVVCAGLKYRVSSRARGKQARTLGPHGYGAQRSRNRQASSRIHINGVRTVGLHANGFVDLEPQGPSDAQLNFARGADGAGPVGRAGPSQRPAQAGLCRARPSQDPARVGLCRVGPNVHVSVGENQIWARSNPKGCRHGSFAKDSLPM